MREKFVFPNVFQCYGDMYNREWSKRVRVFLRFYFARFRCRAQCNVFSDWVNHDRFGYAFFSQNRDQSKIILTKYCDNRFSAQVRYEALKAHFIQSARHFSEAKFAQLVQEKAWKMAELTEELALYFNLNPIEKTEGIFSLSIQNQAGELCYAASFTLNEQGLLIASIQGPKGENAQDLVRQLTKQLHGMRPMFMLINAFKWLAASWQRELFGIGHKSQVKYRWNDSSRLLFNYDNFWQENQSVLRGGYWQLPLEIERKALDEIASKKRAMYRKRYEMFDRVAQEIAQFCESLRAA